MKRDLKSIMSPWDLGELSIDELISVIQYRMNDVVGLKSESHYRLTYFITCQIHRHELVIDAAKARLERLNAEAID